MYQSSVQSANSLSKDGLFRTWLWIGMACPGTVLRKRARKNGFNGCIQARTTAEGKTRRHSLVLEV
jgi:hypothetical protein